MAIGKGKGEYKGKFSKNLKVGDDNTKITTEKGVYQGPLRDGEMDGNGHFKWFDGKIYEGEFKDGELHGDGTMYYPNGQCVRGKWVKGENVFMENV